MNSNSPEVKDGEALPLASQAEFFPELGLLEAAKVWERGANPERTGKILLKDWERCERVLMRLLNNEKQREIAKAEGISRNSLRLLVDIFEARGKLEPLKKRLSRRAGHILDALSEDILQDVENGTLPANVKPIVFGVLADKKAVWDGEPTQVIEVRREGLSVDALEKLYAEAEQRAKAQAIDIESSVLPPNAGGIGGAA